MSFRVALVGAPNCGKSTLFNGLTGGHAKTANYAGVTVESKVGNFATPNGQSIELYDLPGIYGLTPRSPDERAALELLRGEVAGIQKPDLLLIVLDAANLHTHLHSAIQLLGLGLPTIIVLNMIDLAQRDKIKIDYKALEAELGVRVTVSRATRKDGRTELLACVDEILAQALKPAKVKFAQYLKEIQSQARAIAKRVIISEGTLNKATRILDSFALHPIMGPIILICILFFMFQAVFSWASLPQDLLESGINWFSTIVRGLLGQTLFADLIVDGIIAGVGSVIAFLPQIIILFAFILTLEASGYMARAAFLMDEIMRRAGLNGRAFIPLLSSFACAIPGMMAARVIEHERDRLTTILIAPLMTCSARLPVYTLIIAAFIPNTKIGIFGLQGLVMFALYLFGVVGAFIMAFVLKRTLAKGASQELIMELPSYKLPNLRDFSIGIFHSAKSFLKRAGTIILYTSIGLWALARFPLSADSLRNSFAGQLGALIEPIMRPIGFNLEISIALIPGFAAREVAVGALGTIYAISGDNTQGLTNALQNAWSLPTALAFLAWYVFAPQCFATIATIRRETNSWKWAIFAFSYLIILAYIAAFLTFNLSKIWLT